MCAWRGGGNGNVGGLSGKHKNSNVSFIEHVYISDKGTRLIPIDCRDAENIENFKASSFFYFLSLFVSLYLHILTVIISIYRACAYAFMHE